MTISGRNPGFHCIYDVQGTVETFRNNLAVMEIGFSKVPKEVRFRIISKD